MARPAAVADKQLLPWATCAVSASLDADGSAACSPAHAKTAAPSVAFLAVTRLMLCDCRDRVWIVHQPYRWCRNRQIIGLGLQPNKDAAVPRVVPAEPQARGIEGYSSV